MHPFAASLFTELSHIFFPDGLFGNKENSGFIFTRPSLQCFQNVLLPSPPNLIAILIHKWEIPWAKVFPLRLALRLGHEYSSECVSPSVAGWSLNNFSSLQPTQRLWLALQIESRHTLKLATLSWTFLPYVSGLIKSIFSSNCLFAGLSQLSVHPFSGEGLGDSRGGEKTSELADTQTELRKSLKSNVYMQWARACVWRQL